MGRKSKYQTHVEPYLEDISKLVRKGRTEEDISKILGVGYSTFRDYKLIYPALVAALKSGRVTLVEDIKDSIYRSALGLITVKKSKKTYVKDYRTGKMILDKEEVNEDTLAPNVTAIAMAMKLLDPEARKALSNYTQSDVNEISDAAIDNFKMVTDEINRSLEDDSDE